jgi:osmotically inducible protein OsmC
MPEHLQGVLHTAVAVVEGGREGHGRSLDGRFDADLSAPESMGGSGGPGTNPEELFAVGYAACFQSPLLSVANGRRLDTSGSRITSLVGIGPTGHSGFGLTVALDLHAPRLTAEQAGGIIRADGST